MLKKLMLAAAALGSLALAAPAFADNGHRGHARHHFKHHSNHHHYHYYHRRPVVVMPPPRVFYAPPAPVYYAPVPQSSVSIRLHFPL
jgi:hypothetical protein